MSNSKPKVDPSKLDEYSELLKKLNDNVFKLSSSYNGMSSQEKALAGSIVLQVINPWADKNIDLVSGGLAFIKYSLDLLVNKFRILVEQQSRMVEVKGDETELD